MALSYSMMTYYQNLAFILILITWMFKYSVTKGEHIGEHQKFYITHIPIRHVHHIPAFYHQLFHLHHGHGTFHGPHHEHGTFHGDSTLTHHDAATTTTRTPSSFQVHPEWNSYLTYKRSIFNVNDDTYQDNSDKYKSQDSFLSPMDKVYACPN
ncbi:hypothetical protein O3M35_008800 [Rhynocoris fuscipes]|uniref:Uncharacterized protein n=1 Tax=Rhynocoris fuscipes TaxID=488301 RepID=A0AAW1D7I5_9HEMI